MVESLIFFSLFSMKNINVIKISTAKFQEMKRKKSEHNEPVWHWTVLTGIKQ